MKAVRITRPGGTEVLELIDLPQPEPGPRDVLVRNQAIGVGMPDILVRKGLYAWMPRLPAVIGIESAGTVVAVGRQVHEVAIGDSVYINARDLPERSGGYAQYRLAPADAVHPLAAGTDLRKAAALGNYQVAESLLRMAGPMPVRTVAVIGAAGGVGSAAIQLAALRGMQAIGTTAGADKCAWVEAQGALAIDRTQEAVDAGIRRLTQGRGADLILDPVGGAALPALFDALAPLGTVVAYGGLGGEPTPDTVAAMRRHFGASPALRLFSMHSWDDRPDVRRDITRAVIEALERGQIRPQIDRVFPLAEAAAAHAHFESRAHRGKIVLQP